MSVFAVGLGVPGFFWAGLGLASAPVILHLFFRHRYRPIDWAAMKWLLEAVRREYRRIYLEQWLLLAIRALIILLVALAMAQPTLEAPRGLLLADSPVTHHLLVFDNSLSMHYRVTNQSRWERAKGFAHAILDDAQTGDVASVVVMGMPASVLVGDPSPYLDAVAAEIDGITPQHGIARVEPAIDQVAELLKASRAARKRVYFLTDMQRTTWVGDSAEDPGDLGRKLRAVAEQARCTVLDAAGSDSPNQAVVALEQAEPVVIVGRPTVIRATAANFSDSERLDVGLRLLVNGQVEAIEWLAVPAGEQRTVNFAATFSRPGEQVVEVRLPDDPLRLDDGRWLAINVRQSLAVLVIDGEPSGDPFRSEADYLKVALSPGRDEAQPSLIRCETRPESDLLEARLDEWDVVVLANVGQLAHSEAAPLREYVRRGGGLLFFLGSQTNLPAYNQVLFEEGNGLLPARLGRVVGDPKQTQPFFTFDPLDYAHPVVEPFRNAERAGLVTTKTFRYVQAELPRNSSAQVALAYQSGDPAVVLGRYGRGVVGLVTTSADLDWTRWPISPSYVPVIQELVRQLVAGRVRGGASLVGEPIELAVSRPGFQVTATITPPEGGPAALKLAEPEGSAVFRHSGTDRSGIYVVEVGPPLDERHFVAVNSWPVESDLTRATADDLRELFPGWQFGFADRWESSPVSAIAEIKGSAELDRPTLYLALCLLFVETFLAWKFAHHS